MNKNDNILEEMVGSELKIGKYTPSKKFVGFVSAISRTGVRIITNSALVRGNQFSGIGMDGLVFKLTICDNGSINFEEMETSRIDESAKIRFIESICDKDIIGYAGKFVANDIEFYTEEDGFRCYLEIEHTKPINRLAEMLNEFEESKVDFEKIEISEKSKSFLDGLFGNDDIIIEPIKKEEVKSKLKNSSSYDEMIKASFAKMNEEKITELKNRVYKKEEDVKKNKIDISHAEKNLKKSSEDLRILNSRLEELAPADDPNGYCFFVSEEKKTGIEPDPNIIEAVNKISPILNLIPEKVIELLTGGFYTIKITKADDYEKELEETKDTIEGLKEIYKKIESIDFMGKWTLKSNLELEYRGELTYHKLIDKMIRKGFVQIPEFNKICGSNSYGVLRTDEIEPLVSGTSSSCPCGGDCGCGGNCDGNCGENCKCK